MADWEMLGVEEIQKKIKKLNSQSNRLENKAMRAGAEIFHGAIVARAPRSLEPKQPYGKTNKWRTGKHAADILKVGNIRKERGGKVIYVGLLKRDTSKAFYLKFHEWGTTKMPAQPFMEPAAQEKQAEALAAVAQVLKEGFGL